MTEIQLLIIFLIVWGVAGTYMSFRYAWKSDYWRNKYRLYYDLCLQREDDHTVLKMDYQDLESDRDILQDQLDEVREELEVAENRGSVWDLKNG